MQVLFRKAIEKVEVVHECFPKHSCIGTARIQRTTEGKPNRIKNVKQRGHDLKKSQRLGYSSGPSFTLGRYSPKQWMN